MAEKRVMFSIMLLAICIFMGVSGQICWKYGMSSMDEINNTSSLLQPETVLDIITNKYVILGLILYGCTFVLWLSAMSTLDISFMYPMLSFGYVLTALLAFFFLGEQVSTLRWSGIILVVVGCILIMRS